ncbi:beta-N-acetylhexosaminidase [Streptomyces albireticuli]|uniref:beta-N-acetylhexosaminidase n=1 Tax=Streptomyces albireticuli TaxID=1940 RepID=UPI001E3D6017|nr:beta-N-acetylhexosaminidase [Streptomyces albireticuli]MCD9141618.1 beta-N-acetylhexosaminidase [Streptomyces albireticuli]MCD9164131.1 beta-N-acetylhexosaminidase [Streptomyces albireticuli]MCD9189792.1 beta-N-acetylhexosaminidase [Streptomyces albireticuli]
MRRRSRTARVTRPPRLLSALLLVAAALAGTAQARAADGAPGPATPVPLTHVIPAPASVHPGGDPYEITARTRIRVPHDAPEARRIAGRLAALLRPSTGYPLPVTSTGGPGGGDGIRLLLGDPDPALGAEGYRLTVTRRSVTLSAREPAGLFHGVQTLRQLLPPRVERDHRQPGPWTVSGGTVTDVPRYAHRGAMLDVARHFFPVDEVKRTVDQLALYKMNTLHLHLSDDQGWRLAVDSWPRLATYGGSTQVGGGPGGFYDKDDYREIVRYAASRHVTVVPEIDMPGHTNAALASYARLNCDGVAPPLYTGTSVGFSSLCVGKPDTDEFVDDVLGELAELTPGPTLHIGGDEAHSTGHADYAAFMEKAQRAVARHGKRVAGWHQLAGARPAPGALLQYWGYDRTGAAERAQVVAAVRAGAGLVLSPADRAYLDMKYTKDTPLGLEWAGLVEVRRSYDWDPGSYLPGVPESAVAGVEAPLWTETVSTRAQREYLTFPRLPGVAELGWSPRSTHGWGGYRVRLAAQGPRWEAMGVSYYRSPQVPWVG